MSSVPKGFKWDEPNNGLRLGRFMKPMIVAVDGPAGSGKSSVCAKVCEKIGWTYVNTGFLYRAVALLAMRKEADLKDEASLLGVTKDFAENHRWEPSEGALYYKDENITALLSGREVGLGASSVALLPSIREHLLPVQRSLGLACPVGAIVDGRDIGTVVFPDADLKIFMTASLAQRALRRQAQLNDKPQNLAEIEQEIASRDEQDAERSTAPLKCAEDAVVLDTSDMGVDASIDTLIGILEKHRLLQSN